MNVSRKNKKKRTRKGGENLRHAVFIFSIIGGELSDEENWQDFPLAAITKEAKKKLKQGAKTQLRDIPNIKTPFSFSFKRHGLVVTTILDTSAEEEEEEEEEESVEDLIANVVDDINEKSIWQTNFDIERNLLSVPTHSVRHHRSSLYCKFGALTVSFT
jgi:hypothetical protein